jgi:hypothetical protein
MSKSLILTLCDSKEYLERENTRDPKNFLTYSIHLKTPSIMKDQRSGISDIENTLQEVGRKIEELIAKGAEAGGEVKEEIEKKIAELRENKTTLEEELKKGKEMLEREFKEKREEYEPRFKESKGFFLEGFRQLGLAFKSLFSKK